MTASADISKEVPRPEPAFWPSTAQVPWRDVPSTYREGFSAAAFLLSPGSGVEAFAHQTLPRLLRQFDRNPVRRTRDSVGAMRGKVDWPATAREWPAEVAQPTRFRCRVRHWEVYTPANRAVAGVLAALGRLAQRVPAALGRGTVAVGGADGLTPFEAGSSQVRVERLRRALEAARQNPVWAGIDAPGEPSRRDLEGAARHPMPEYRESAALWERWLRVAAAPDWAAWRKASGGAVPLADPTDPESRPWLVCAISCLLAVPQPISPPAASSRN